MKRRIQQRIEEARSHRKRSYRRKTYAGGRPAEPKWSARRAVTAEEMFLCQVVNDPDWVGPWPLPGSPFGSWIELAKYAMVGN